MTSISACLALHSGYTVYAIILALPTGILARFLRYAERMEAYGPDLGMPHSRAMGGGIFELRAAEGIPRVFYCTVVGLRWCFSTMKKTEKMRSRELDVARRRMKEVKHD